MTKDEIQQALRLTAMGRCGHPLQEQLAEKLAGLFVTDSCEHCTMPGGKHYAYCPNNPTREQDAPSVYAPEPKRTRKAKAD